MRFQNSAFIFVLIFSLFLMGCWSDETPSNKNTESNSSTTNESAAANSNINTTDPLATESNSAPKEMKEAITLKPVIDAYCAAINKGDNTALKNIYSLASWKALSADARAEGQNSVAKYLADSEPIGNKCQVVNERVAGNVAEALVITQTYPNGVPLKFVNEGGGWKMTNQSSDFDAVRKNSK